MRENTEIQTVWWENDKFITGRERVTRTHCSQRGGPIGTFRDAMPHSHTQKDPRKQPASFHSHWLRVVTSDPTNLTRNITIAVAVVAAAAE